MSQFLICKSKEKLSKYGSRLNNVVSNRELYDKVIDKYMKNENIDMGEHPKVCVNLQTDVR